MSTTKKLLGWGKVMGLLLTLFLCHVSSAYPTDPGVRSLSPEDGLDPVETLKLAPGYCPSIGGSHSYESIASVSTVQAGQTMTITVNLWIANPTGCTAGSPCPEYDASPEYINVWIDWDGDKVWESNEKVMDVALTGYLGINYHGTMTWPTQVTVPPNAVGTTWLRANLGWGFDPNNPCEYSWTWGDVHDQQVTIEPTVVKVKELRVSGNVGIHGVSNPIWSQNYDSDGNAQGNPIQKPVADAMNSTFYSGKFKITSKLQAFPDFPPGGPKVECQWKVYPFLMSATPLKSGAGTFTGQQGSFWVEVPQKVGRYSLGLDYTIKDQDDNVIGNQTVMVDTLFVTYKSTLFGWLTKKTVKRLNKACWWASEATNENEACANMVDGIYQKHGGWIYKDNGEDLWEKLVEDHASYGNCVDFALVWHNLCKVLGVSGTSLAPYQYGQHNHGFLTITPTVALDGEIGNAYPGGSGFGSRDRWRFGMHSVGKHGAQYYDPTVGNVYSNDRQYIEWDNTGTAVSGPGGYSYRKFEKVGGSEYVKVRWTSQTTTNGWWASEYYGPYTSEPPSAYGKDDHILASLGGLSGGVFAMADGAIFTGGYSDTTIDTDTDGVANILLIEADVEVTTAGRYVIFGTLQFGDSIITSRPTKNMSGPSVFELIADVGIQTIAVEFSGEDILTRGFDGPYDVHLTIMDDNSDVVDTATFVIQAYSHNEFGEISTIAISCYDSGVDLNGNGLYEYLSVEISVTSTKAMKCGFGAFLTTSDTLIITEVYDTASVAVGSNTITLRFKGEDINDVQADGPYHVTTIIYDSSETPISQNECSTSAYNYLDFEPKKGKLEGYFDYGQDYNSNGLFDVLTVGAIVSVEEASTYRVSGWLSDADRDEIGFAEGVASLAAGQDTILLDFDGTLIFENGMDGPYNLSYACLERDDGSVVDDERDAYSIGPYSYLSFERPVPLLIALTGNYTDNGQDTDGNGLFDYMTVGVEVTCSDDGVAVANARLVAPDGEDILWASAFTPVSANVPAMISLDFDGRYIFGSLQDGLYPLMDLLVYHTGDPSQSAYISEPYVTNAYEYTDFEPAAVICGTVMDNDIPVPGAFLIIEGVDYDYTNSVGYYDLVSLQSGSYLVEIEPPAGFEAESWFIFVNDVFIGEGTAVTVAATVGEVTQVDFTTAVQKKVNLDIKPQSCPNPLNVKNPRTDAWMEDKDSENTMAAGDTWPYDHSERAAVLPVAILGTGDFDVTDIDPARVMLEGVEPIRWSLEDVAAPVDDTAECACTTRGPDGFKDLTLKFDRAAIIAALGDVADGDVVVLTITGDLYDGTPIVGTDCVIIRGDREVADGTPSVGEEPEVLLLGNYPNPFNPVTDISFSLPTASRVKLEIFNIVGQKVATLVDGRLETGEHIIQWDGSNVASGVYLYRLQADDFVDTRKMLLLK